MIAEERLESTIFWLCAISSANTPYYQVLFGTLISTFEQPRRLKSLLLSSSPPFISPYGAKSEVEIRFEDSQLLEYTVNITQCKYLQ